MKKTEVILVDDIDGSSADRTISFSVNGVSFEIDLNEEHATELLEDFAKWESHARRVGGRATAMMLIQVPLLGSSSAGETRLVLGANPELEARYLALQQQMEKELAAQDSLLKLIAHLTAAGDPKDMLGRAQASLKNAQNVHAQSQLALEDLEQQLAKTRHAAVNVGMAVAGAVDIAFGRVQARLRREYRTGSFRLDSEGVVVFTDRSGYAVPAV